MITKQHCWLLCCVVMVSAACGSEQTADVASIADDGFMQWRLPEKLREISGLALTDDQRLLAVADEEAIVYEINYDDGQLVKAFAFGEPTLRDDFEGIAVFGGRVWLMNSDGDLFSAPEGRDGERVSFEKYKFPFKDRCELEGLTADKIGKSLLLLCKDASKKKDRLMFVWSMAGESRKYRIPEFEMADSVGKRRVHPSGIEIDPETGNLIVVASRERAVFSLSPSGDFIGLIMELDKNRHRQAEGITVTDDGRLLIADEATSGPATLTVYSADYYREE